MNKKVVFILLPILVLCLLMYSNSTTLGCSCNTHGFSIGKVISGKLPVSSTDIHKHNNFPNKNKIRVKAWDDYSPTALVAVLFIPRKFFSTSASIFFECDSSALTGFHTGVLLRGPPSVS